MNFNAYILILFFINSSYGQHYISYANVKCGMSYKSNYDLIFYSNQAKDTISGVVTMDYIFEQDKNILYLLEKEVFMIRIKGDGKVFFKKWIKIDNKTKLVENLVLLKILEFCVCWNNKEISYNYNKLRMNYPFKIIPVSGNE